MGLRLRIVLINLAVFIASFCVVFVLIMTGLVYEYERQEIDSVREKSYNISSDILSVMQIAYNEDQGSSGEKAIISLSQDEIKALFNSKSRYIVSVIEVNNADYEIILFSDGKKITTPRNVSLQSMDFPEIQQAVSGDEAYIIRNINGERTLFFAFPIKYEDNIIGQAILISSLQAAQTKAWSLALLFALALLGGTVIVVIANFISVQRIAGPIIDLKNATMKTTESILDAEEKGEELPNIAEDYYKSKIFKRAFLDNKGIKTHKGNELYELTRVYLLMTEEVRKNINLISTERNKLKSIIDSMGEGVLALDNDKEIIVMNNAAMVLMDDEFKAQISNFTSEIEQSGKVFECNIKEFYVLVYVTPLFFKDKKEGYVVVINDVTELKELQNKQKQFVASVSHELRTPLTVILGYIDLLKEKGDNPKVVEMCVEHLSDSSTRLQHLINDLLDLASISQTEFEVVPASTDLSKLVNNVVKHMRIKARKFNTVIESKIEDVGDVMVDKDRIHQVMVNIVDNAIKYSPAGRISVLLNKVGEFVEITVEDNGCGMSEDMKEKVFEPFFRIDMARTRNSGGTGLGLSIVKEIVSKHNGIINVESELNKGTKITIKLPII